MSWYKHAKDYVGEYSKSIPQPPVQAEEQLDTPIAVPMQMVQPAQVVPKKINKFLSIEQELDKMRRNQTENPYLINETKQPVRVKSTGQGADALLQTNRDFPAYTDNFTKTTTWNSN